MAVSLDDMVNDIWAAFPDKYAMLGGSRTIGGQYCLRSKVHGYVWAWPDEGVMSKVGQTKFEEAKNKLDLLPDPRDLGTRNAIRSLLAQRVDLDPSYGLVWGPKAKNKRIVGWALGGRSKQVFFPYPVDAPSDPTLALVKTLALVNTGKMDWR